MNFEKESLFLELNFRNESEGEAKEVKILPIGKEVQGIDGRKFAVDAEKVLESLKKEPADLMLDLNHDSKGEAMGWFKNPKLKEDGIYAELETTPKGKELIENRLYRYLSPAIFIQKEGEVAKATRLHSVGLVNRPNLGGLALNSQESSEEGSNSIQNKGKKMAEKNEGNQKEESLKEALEKKEKEVAELKAQLETLNKEKERLAQEKEDLAKEKEKLEKNAKEERVERAILAGELLPKRKEEVLECNSSEIDKHLEIYKIEAKNTLKASGLEKNKIEPAATSEDPIALEIKRQLGIFNNKTETSI